VAVEVVEFLKSFANDELAELGEGDIGLGSIVLQDLFELGAWVVDFEFPIIDQNVGSFDELGLRNTTVLAVSSSINFLKGLPKLVVETKVDEGKLEGSSADQTFGQGVSGFDLLKGSLIGPHDDRLRIEEFWHLQNVSKSFVDFSKGEPVVSVDVKLSENLFPGCDVLRGRTDRYLSCFFFGACSHYLSYLLNIETY
jgi:hypothetical protein